MGDQLSCGGVYRVLWPGISSNALSTAGSLGCIQRWCLHCGRAGKSLPQQKGQAAEGAEEWKGSRIWEGGSFGGCSVASPVNPQQQLWNSSGARGLLPNSLSAAGSLGCILRWYLHCGRAGKSLPQQKVQAAEGAERCQAHP